MDDTISTLVLHPSSRTFTTFTAPPPLGETISFGILMSFTWVLGKFSDELLCLHQQHYHLLYSRRLCSQHGTVHSSHLPHSRTFPALSKHLVSEEGDSERHLSRGRSFDLFRLRWKFGDVYFHPRGSGVIYKTIGTTTEYPLPVPALLARFFCFELACLSSPYLLLHPCACLPCCLLLTRWVALGFW